MVTDWTNAEARGARTGTQTSQPLGWQNPSGAPRHSSPRVLAQFPTCPGGAASLPSKDCSTTPCAAGFYCPEGSGEPSLCPRHTVAAAPGAKQQEDCRPCPAGHWCKVGEAPVPQPGVLVLRRARGGPLGRRGGWSPSPALLSRGPGHLPLPHRPLLPWR